MSAESKAKKQPVTTAVITDNVARVNDIFSNPGNPKHNIVIADIETLEKNIIAHEEKALKDLRPCPTDRIHNYRSNLPTIEPSGLTTIKDHYLEPESAIAIACAHESIMFSSGDSSNHALIRRMFHNLKRIGAPSAEGIAALGDFAEATKTFVLKRTRDKRDDANLRHELVVGTYLNNKRFKGEVPNFALVYGGFQCSPSLIEEKTEKLTPLCPGNGTNIQYVMYEFITGMSFGDYLNSAGVTAAGFLSAYLQIGYALLATPEFSHFDLHPGNVMLRESPEGTGPVDIVYRTEAGKQEVLTAVSGISTIIDYGMAFLDIPGIGPIGRTDLPEFSISSNFPSPLHDLYKLLAFVIYKLINITRTLAQEEVLSYAIIMFKYFNPVEDVQVAITKQIKVYFSFPGNAIGRTYNLPEYLEYIRANLSTPFIKPYNAKTDIFPLCRRTGSCLERKNVEALLGFGETSIHNSFWSVYDAIKLGKPIPKTFNYMAALTDFEAKIEVVMKAELEKLNSLVVVNLDTDEYRALATHGTMVAHAFTSIIWPEAKRIRQMNYTVYMIISYHKTMSDMIDVGDTVTLALGKPQATTALKQHFIEHPPSAVRKLENMINRNNQIIRSAVNSGTLQIQEDGKVKVDDLLAAITS